MIVAIERSKFTYLYKYNQIRVDINQIIDQPLENLKWMLQSDFNELLKLFNKAIPLFEQDHEIILLEVEKSKIEFHDGILISFDSILCIYPLTIIGSKLLEGKISYDFFVELPVFEKCVESLKIIRSMVFRKSASEKLLVHFKLSELLNKELLSVIEESVNKNLLDKSEPQVFTSFLDHLIGYNKTPSYIPDGNIEYICKIGAIAIKYLGKPEEVFTNGPFYKSSLKYKSKINNNSYLDSYLDFITIPDSELKKSYEKMVELISKDYKGVDIFKVSYFFLAFKSFVNKNDNNIEAIKNEIDTLINEDRNTATFVLSLLGYTFSMENIYEGIHRLSNAPLLKSTRKKKVIELESAEREKAKIERKKEAAIKLSEPSNNKEIPDEVIAVPETQEIETIPNDVIEKPIEEIAIEPSETVSEPSVIYEMNGPISEVEKVIKNKSDAIREKEVQSIIITDVLEEKSDGRQLLTVQFFRSYLSNKVAKSKHKNWFQFLDYYFPIKNEELSLERLELNLDNKPELKEKLYNSKKDKESIKAFFEANK